MEETVDNRGKQSIYEFFISISAGNCFLSCKINERPAWESWNFTPKFNDIRLVHEAS